MYFVPYNIILKDYARYLRKRSTLGEVLLWNELRAGKLMGYKFNRQRPLHCYIVDFYCKPLNLVIEVDGDIHIEDEVRLKDEERQAVLQSYGLHFLRFEDVLVRQQMDVVLAEIEKWILENK